MSVINQVLSDLEKRGATALPGDAVIRAVPVQHKRRALWLVLVAGVLGLAAGGLWWSKEKKVSEPFPPLPTAGQIITAQTSPSPPGMIATETPAAEKEESYTPAMRLSFELSSVPPPSNSRPQSRPVENKVNATGKNAPGTAKEKLPTGEKLPIKADNEIKQFSPQQLQENEFRRATALVQQGRSNEAYIAFEALLQRDAGYDAARQAMVAILLDSKRNADAERLLQDGLQHNAKHSGFAMLLARLQVDRGALTQALETLHKTLPYAERQADYRAFVAALLQRQNNHAEAIEHYKIAVQLVPNSGVWQMGLGISLQAINRNDEARDAFKRAIGTGSLSAELHEFVVQRLKELE